MMQKAAAQRRFLDAVTPLFLILIAFLLSAVWILLMGKNPLDAYAALFSGAFGSTSGVINTIKKAVPIAFTSFAVIVSTKASVFNIGAEGQLAMGAFGAAMAGIFLKGIPSVIHIPLAILAAAAAGMAFALVPAWLRVKRGANLLVILLLMNNIARFLLQYFVLDAFASSNAMVPSTDKIMDSAKLPYLIGPPYRLTIAILIVLVVAALLEAYFHGFTSGYEMRAVGLNPEAARYAGIDTKKYMLMGLLVSGALAGIGGGLEILGNHHRLYLDFSPGYGYDGIPIALLAGGSPMLSILGSLLFGALRTGSLNMQAQVGISDEIISVIQGSLILCIGANYFVKYLIHRISSGKKRAGDSQ